MNNKYEIIRTKNSSNQSMEVKVDADWLHDICIDWYGESDDEDDVYAMAVYENISEDTAWDIIYEAVKYPTQSRIAFTDTTMNTAMNIVRELTENIISVEKAVGCTSGITVEFDMEACENEYLSVLIDGHLYSNCLSSEEAVSTVANLLRGFQQKTKKLYLLLNVSIDEFGNVNVSHPIKHVTEGEAVSSAKNSLMEDFDLTEEELRNNVQEYGTPPILTMTRNGRTEIYTITEITDALFNA